MTHELSFRKVTNPASKKQIDALYANDNVTINSPSVSQLAKRLDAETASELLSAAENGEKVIINA